MSDVLINQIKQIANAERADHVSAKYGRISAYNPANYTAKVILYPEEVETGWLPIGTIWAGQNWGLFCGPHINMPCKVAFPEDNVNNGLIDLVVNLGEFRPVSDVKSGEFLIKHISGSFLKFNNDGSVEIKGAPVNIEGGNVAITGADITIEGSSVSIGDSGEAFTKVLVEHAKTTYNSHSHGDNGADPPNFLMDDDDLSSVTEVN